MGGGWYMLGSGNPTVPQTCPMHPHVVLDVKNKPEPWYDCSGMKLCGSSLPLWIWPIFRAKKKRKCWFTLQLPTLATTCADLAPPLQTHPEPLTAFPKTLQVWKEWHSWRSFGRQLKLMSWLSKAAKEAGNVSGKRIACLGSRNETSKEVKWRRSDLGAKINICLSKP